MKIKISTILAVFAAFLGNSVTPAQDQIDKTDKNYVISQIVRSARQYNIKPALALAVAEVENHFRNKTSKANALGVMQIKLGTASDLGFDGNEEQLKQTDANVDYGVQFLKVCVKKAHGDMSKLTCCYNQGQYANPNVCEREDVVKYHHDVVKALAKWSHGGAI